MFLEEWLHARIQRAAKEDPEYERYTGKEGLKEITRQEIENFQLFSLRKILSYAHKKSAFYRDLFDKEGIGPEGIKSLDDLAKIPFTQPTSLAETPYRFLCVPLSEVARVFTLSTSGTTGPPKKVFFTDSDLDAISDYMGAAMKAVALCGGLAEKGYVVQILLPDGRPMSQADLLAKGIKKEQGLPIIGDLSLGTEDQVKAIERAKPDILFGSTSRLYRITQESRQHNDLGKIGVHILFLTSEYLSDSMRKELRKVWNGDVYLHYGMTEMGLGGGIECHVHNGFHFNEADFLFEVVDPATGAVLKEGEEGELVFTTLNREGMPLIRYRTGDLSTLISTPCECGASTLRRIGKVSKRVKSIVRMGRGEEIYPSLFDDVLYSVANIIDYQVSLIQEGDKEGLSFKVEVVEEQPRIEQEIAEAILKIPSVKGNIEADLMTLPRIEIVGRGMIKREGRRKKLIVDERASI